MGYLLIVKYRDADEPIETSADEHTALAMARSLDDTHTEWADMVDETGKVIWDNVNGFYE